jgi:hypothetical protein
LFIAFCQKALGRSSYCLPARKIETWLQEIQGFARFENLAWRSRTRASNERQFFSGLTDTAYNTLGARDEGLALAMGKSDGE